MHQSYERRCSRKIGWAKSYVAIDGEFGNSGDVCVFSKDQKFKPSKSQGDGLNWSSFLEEASNKGLVYRSDFFGLCGCLSPAYWNGTQRAIEEMEMKEKKDEFEGGPNEPQKKDGESENVEKMAF